jgi:uncharacterized protein involved in exopolysaccharide biosynthesis
MTRVSEGIDMTGGAGSRSPREERERHSFNELRTSAAEVVRILSVRRWMFFVPFCLVTTAAFVLSLAVPRRYEAVTTFERRDDPVLMNLPRAGGAGPFEIFRRTLVQDLTNPSLLVPVVERLGLAEQGGHAAPESPDANATPRGVRALASGISEGLKVSLRDRSPHLDVIEIKYTTSHPDTMIAVLDDVRDNYIRMTRARITTHLRQAKEWFDRECEEKRNELDRLRDELLTFQSEHLGLNPLDPDTGLIKLASMRSDMEELERRRRDLTIRLEGRTRLLEATDTGGDGATAALAGAKRGPLAEALAAELRATAQEIDELKGARGMTERHPKIVRLRARSDRIAAEIEREEQKNIDGVPAAATGRVGGVPAKAATQPRAHSQAQVDIMVLEQLLVENEAEIREQRDAIRRFEVLRTSAVRHRKEFSDRQDEIGRLSTELSLYRKYADQVGRLLEADESQRGVLFEKIKTASGSSVPVSPRISTIVVLTLIAGIASGVVMILLAELFDRTIRTQRQIARGLGLNILESIDEIVTSGARRWRLARVVFIPVACGILACLVLGSGSLAYLSLERRAFFQRVITLPRSALGRVVGGFEGGADAARSAIERLEQLS